ncbi:cilia- and flagella-associated protein 91 [Melanotaenia boesemani]|uniref:cilia- and flagella-associated protein 91 n=1 Tax=Melanotaenia boesemani TaxID=1250792 RepID=UPI001C053E5A|nr:cilia- and flagella-associated protein 91 [Melanotaenia boesemani]
MSTSLTHTVTKKHYDNEAATRERTYDYLYDPVYTVSSELDHTRRGVYAMKGRLRRVPEFASMFSDNPRYTVKLNPVDPVPAFIDHRWRGHAEQRREVLQQLAGFIPNAQTRLKRTKGHVTGADYWKYLKRPLIPLAEEFPPNLILASPRKNFITTDGKNDEQQPTHCTVGVQTDYRENETQTDPYSPEYAVKPGTTASELLQLAALTWGHGLPAGLAEVEMIERLRAKRAWEASLPPLNDLSQLDKRRRMMEEMEAKQWAFREGEIQKLQEARFAVLKDLLRQKEEAQRDLTTERLNRIYSEQQKNKETKLHKIHTDYVRSLRKLEAKRKNVEGKLQRWDIITGSQTYVRQTLRNFSTDSDKFTSHSLISYEGLLELEASVFKPQVLNDVIEAPVNKAVELFKEYKTHREEMKAHMREKSLRFLVKKKKPKPRPVTPRVEQPLEGDEEAEFAAIHLQKLLRGRRIQYEMFKAKENQQALIQELRTVHALQSEEQQLQKADKELVLTLEKQRNQQRLKISQEEASHARVVGAELEQVFDTLSKELIHFQEERRIHAFALLAERERRRREAEESGRRQVEERRRREEDDIFRQVVQVHQESVDMYLEDIILETLEQVADQQAREEIRKKAKELSDIVYSVEESQDNLQSEEIVSELVYSFLVPEVKKSNVRQRVHQKQLKHLQAAQSIIQGTAAPAGIQPPGASQRTSSSVGTSSGVIKEISQAEQGKQTESE